MLGIYICCCTPHRSSAVSVVLTFNTSLNASASFALSPFAVLLVSFDAVRLFSIGCYRLHSLSTASAVLTFNAALSARAPSA